MCKLLLYDMIAAITDGSVVIVPGTMQSYLDGYCYMPGRDINGTTQGHVKRILNRVPWTNPVPWTAIVA